MRLTNIYSAVNAYINQISSSTLNKDIDNRKLQCLQWILYYIVSASLLFCVLDSHLNVNLHSFIIFIIVQTCVGLCGYFVNNIPNVGTRVIFIFRLLSVLSFLVMCLSIPLILNESEPDESIDITLVTSVVFALCILVIPLILSRIPMWIGIKIRREHGADRTLYPEGLGYIAKLCWALSVWILLIVGIYLFPNLNQIESLPGEIHLVIYIFTFALPPILGYIGHSIARKKGYHQATPGIMFLIGIISSLFINVGLLPYLFQ